MFRGGIGPNEASRLIECHRTINAVIYIAILHDNLLLSIYTINNEEKRHFILQHDNGPPHKGEKTKIYAKVRGISFAKRPPNSPD